jgi:hypothetical protein
MITPSPRIDTETFTSKAITQLADRREMLERLIAGTAERSRAQAETMTKTQLISHLLRDAERGRLAEPNLSGKETKAALVELSGELYSRSGEAGTELANLTRAARADRRLAQQINTMLDKAETEYAKLAPTARDREPNVFDAAYGARNHTDAFMVAVEAARFASSVVRGVADGEDIREVALAVAKQALRVVLAFPRRAAHFGVGTRSSEVMYEAAGAKEFMATVARTYARLDDLMIDLAELAY